ncbi:hypothetical protein SAMN05192566_1914 [Methylophilus rhizosphaerae]|uniref:Uncharacterized protein n=2 Tax=Methylophilus rhizosphaerae TaxID=492660 RepID=A0A1G9DCV8_9PROT|nr:hypothetical protein SAMN05192566_1914 [Methylophilus rhizosphaerae]
MIILPNFRNTVMTTQVLVALHTQHSAGRIDYCYVMGLPDVSSDQLSVAP